MNYQEKLNSKFATHYAPVIDISSYRTRENPERTTSEDVLPPSEEDIDEINALLVAAGIAGECSHDADELIADFANTRSYCRFVGCLFGGRQCSDEAVAQFIETDRWDVDVTAYHRDFDNRGQSFPPGLSAVEAGDAIVSVRSPLESWTWIKSALLESVKSHGASDPVFVAPHSIAPQPSSEALAARHEAALRCVESFGVLVKPEEDPADAARIVESCFFDSGLSETDVARLFWKVASSIRLEPEEWCIESEGKPDILWVSEIFGTIPALTCFCGKRCEIAEPPDGIKGLEPAALEVADLLVGVLREPFARSSISGIARQLHRGWTPGQLVRAACGYREMWPTVDGMSATDFYGHGFDVFKIGRHFVGPSGSYARAIGSVAWYP